MEMWKQVLHRVLIGFGAVGEPERGHRGHGQPNGAGGGAKRRQRRQRHRRRVLLSRSLQRHGAQCRGLHAVPLPSFTEFHSNRKSTGQGLQ